MGRRPWHATATRMPASTLSFRASMQPYALAVAVTLLLCSCSAHAASVVVQRATIAATASVAASTSSGATPKPPPSYIVAAVKAAREAQELLLSTTTSAEAEAAVNMLNTLSSHTRGGEERSRALPPGAQAWCPMLSLYSISGQLVESPVALANAINGKYVMKGMTWKAAMDDELAAIGVAGAWWSVKERPVPVTLITQSSVDRLPQLYSQCKSWGGPLSAVIFLGLLQDSVGGLTDSSNALIKKAAVHVSAAGQGVCDHMGLGQVTGTAGQGRAGRVGGRAGHGVAVAGCLSPGQVTGRAGQARAG